MSATLITDGINLVMFIGSSIILNVLAAGRLRTYFIVPIALSALHLVGNEMQEREIGPEWIQDHLHNAGIAAGSCSAVAIYLLARGQFKEEWKPGDNPLLAPMTIAFIPRWHGAVTLFLILLEVVQVVVNRDSMMARGYSGAVDVGDIVAYLIGFAVIVANHAALRRSVLREPEESSCPEMIKS